MTDDFPLYLFYPPKFERRWMRILALVLYPVQFAVAGVVLLVGGVALVCLTLGMIAVMTVKSVAGYVIGEKP